LVARTKAIAGARGLEHSAFRRRFSEIYRSQRAYVATCLRKLGISSHDLDDLGQEVFLRVLRALPAFNTERPFRPWLRALIVHTILDFRKQPARRERNSLDAASQSDAADLLPPPDEALAGAQDRALILRALENLPMKKRLILIMVELDGNSVPEVAAALEVPLNTAYSRLRIAREDLAATIQRLLNGNRTAADRSSAGATSPKIF
jgi:RNA polymerase sigma-70 factor, ECF subfamily